MIALRPIRLLPLVVALMVGAATAQVQVPVETAEDSRKLLAEAQAQGEQARRRAEALEANAASAVAAADKTAQEAAAVAARIQQTEAKIAENEARIRALPLRQQAKV